MKPEQAYNALASFGLGTEAQLMAVPNWLSPRLVIEDRCWRQRWQDSRAFYPAITFRAKLFALWVRVRMTLTPGRFTWKCTAIPPVFGGANWMRWVPGIKHSAIYQSWNPLDSIWRYESDEYPEELLARLRRKEWDDFIAILPQHPDRAIMLVGAAADPRQKMIFKMVSKSGQVLAYLKWGLKPVACQLVQREMEILKELPERCGPQVLGSQPLGGGFGLLLAPIAGQVPIPRLPVPRAVDALLTRLDVHPSVTYPVEDHPRLRWLMARDPNLGACLVALAGRQWSAPIQHGDCSPWNFLRTGLQVQAIDWEEAVLKGFPYWDKIYYILQTAFFIKRWSPEKAFSYLCTELASSGLDHCTAAALIRLAALDAYWRNREANIPETSDLQAYRLAIGRYQAGQEGT